MSDHNPVHELIEVEKSNQKLLKEMLESQKELIEVTKAQHAHGRWKLGLEFLKIIMWPAILFLVLYFSTQAIKGFTEAMIERTNPQNLIESFKPGPDSNAQGLNDLLNNFLSN